MDHIHFGRLAARLRFTKDLVHSILRFNKMQFHQGLLLVSLLLFLPSNGVSQVVQLPTTGSFSLQTSVLAPDSGSAFLGGGRANAIGARSLGPGSIANGGSASVGNANVSATIIDLNELDQMIRSQSGSKSTDPNLSMEPRKKPQYPMGNKGSPAQKAEYEYLAALTHVEPVTQGQMSSDINYYLSLATNAQRQGHWASVELYYKLAWQSLPESRRQRVLLSLEEARRTAAAKETKVKK